MRFLSRKNIKLVSVVIVLVAVVIFSSRGADNPVKGTVLWATSPFLKTFHIFSGGIHGLFQFLGSIGELKDENERLVGENQELVAEIAKLKDIDGENELLRKEIDLVPRNKYDLEASFVVAQDSLGSTGAFLIDKGRNRGIREGMAVIVSKGILVGKVSEVFSDTAKVILVTDQSSAVNGEISGSGVRGIVKGTYGLGIMMDMISQAEIVQEGDTVITSGLGGDVPRGLYIGKIGEVGQSTDKLFQQATVFSSADLTSLRVVFVVKGF